MDYEGRICRPPMERSSFMLGISVGCAYNKCKFCSLFKDLKYRLLPLEQIEEELIRIHSLGGNPKKVFLGDGNALGIKMDRLTSIIKMIKEYFPNVEEINCDATITDIKCKSDKELITLSSLGVKNVYIGIEGGLDDVLLFMRKEHNMKEARDEIKRLQKSGMIFNAHIMSGFAGKNRGIENAIALANFLNETKPSRITDFSMMIGDYTELAEDVYNGLFTPASEIEKLEESKKLVELLNIDNLIYDSFHDEIEFRVRGKLPFDKEKMIEKIDREIQKRNNIQLKDVS
ncbi:MAG: radical SAM protein [Lachnospiraceae bacterium]|jgi:radical SAM superfamily enzyme YgiQ (UPF0313 family)|nr:radical SAM protein [Lachnospiraceae bacterium]